MKSSTRVLLAIIAVFAVVVPIMAQDNEDTLKQLDAALQATSAYNYSGDNDQIQLIESVVVQCLDNAQLRETVEQKLITSLSAATAGGAKSFICRQLRTIGTSRSVSELEKLLTDPKLSDMGCYALGRIECAEASEALYRAMGKTSGKTQLGIINALGTRGYEKALPDLIKLLGSSDQATAGAAARSIGIIGGAKGVKALSAALSNSSAEMRISINNALLSCAEKYMTQGNKNESARVYSMLYEDNKARHLKLAALRGLIYSQGSKSLALLTESITSADMEMQRNAIGFMSLIDGSEATKAYIAILPALSSPEAQALVIRSLGSRGDVAASAAISNAVKSENEEVKLAAIEALGGAGDCSSVSVLAQVAAEGDGTIKKIARASLVQLKEKGVDEVIIKSISEGDPKIRSELIIALSGRDAKQAAGQLLKTAMDEDKGVRQEAIRALGALAAESDIKALIALILNPKDADDRPVLEQAVDSVFKRTKNVDNAVSPILAALETSSNDAKPSLLRLLARPATPNALETVLAYVQNADEKVKDAAVRTLSEWPDTAAAEKLLSLAQNASTQIHKILALRGYVRLAGKTSDPTAMYIRAMDLAERPEDKKLVLGGLATASSDEVIAIISKYLKDEQLQAEAGLAAMQIATTLSKDNVNKSKALLKDVMASVKDESICNKAKELLNDFTPTDGHILDWFSAGPYTLAGKDAEAVHNEAFPPEKNDTSVKWEKITKGISDWSINLESQYGAKDVCCAYMRTTVISPVDQDIRLEMGCDDSIKAWVNGELVHSEKYRNGGLRPREFIAKAKLKKGENQLVLKVVDNSGGWAFGCRIRKADGDEIEGLKIEAK